MANGRRWSMQLKLAARYLIAPAKPADYAVSAGLFLLTAILTVLIGTAGLAAIATIPRWQWHAPVYLIILGTGIAVCSGASIYCVNQMRIAAVNSNQAVGRLRRLLIATSVEVMTFLLALVQLAATSIVVLIIGMHLFGVPLPTLHALRQIIDQHL